MRGPKPRVLPERTFVILTAAGLPVSSSSILHFLRTICSPTARIKRVNPPPTFRVLSADVQPVWWATTIKRALRRERKRKQRYVRASSVSRLNIILIPIPQTYRYGRETVKTSSFIHEIATLVFTLTIFTTEYHPGHRIFHFSLIVL